MSLSDATQNPNLAVASLDELRSIPIAALRNGERVALGSDAYALDKSAFDAESSTVVAARPAIVGPFPPVVVDPLIPGRWKLVPTGGGIVGALNSRRDHSVNGARVDGVRDPAGFVLRTQTNNNVAGSYTGGGIGNKAMAGHFLPAPLLLSALLNVEWVQEVLVPEAVGAVIRPFANLVVELDPAGAPGVYSILVLGDISSALNLGTYTPLSPTKTLVQWSPTANLVSVVVDKGMAILPNPPGPVFVPVSQGPAQSTPGAWPGHAYSIANILAVYPNARIVNANPADGGMPANTVMSGLILVLGDSANKVQNAIQITDWKLNGASI